MPERSLCPENWSRSSGYGCNADIQGPHHWVRVGTWADVQSHYVSNEGTYGLVNGNWGQLAPYHYTTRVDRPVYECVFCLEGKRQERPAVDNDVPPVID